MPGHRVEAFRRLYQIAERQRGLFTSKQAVSAGFSHSTHGHHVRAGNWVRAHRGIYRLALGIVAAAARSARCSVRMSGVRLFRRKRIGTVMCSFAGPRSGDQYKRSAV